MSAGQTRRRVLEAAGVAMAGTAGLVVAGCGGPTHHRPKTKVQISSQDVPVVLDLLAIEQRTVALYEAGIPLLGTAAAKDAQQFLGQEESHVGELTGLLKTVNITAPTAGTFHLGHPTTAGQVLRLLERLENEQLGAYLRALPRVSGGPVRSALAAIFANDAQHVMLLGVHLGRPASPAAFVTPRQ